MAHRPHRLLRGSPHSLPGPTPPGDMEVPMVSAPSLCWAGTRHPCSLGGSCEPWGMCARSLGRMRSFSGLGVPAPCVWRYWGALAPFISAGSWSLLGTEPRSSTFSPWCAGQAAALCGASIGSPQGGSGHCWWGGGAPYCPAPRWAPTAPPAPAQHSPLLARARFSSSNPLP